MNYMCNWLNSHTEFGPPVNALFTKIQKLEEQIALLYHKKLISKNLETVEMSLTGVLGAIFETEEEEEENE